MASFTLRAGSALLSLFALLIPLASADYYYFHTKFVGRDFLERWTWFIQDDPTHGRVNYIDQATALQRNLSFASDSKFVMRADSDNVVNPSSWPTPRGRNSVRIQSVEAFSDAIIILDLQHMPEGCTTWPAFWSVSQAGPWPKGGEIDIIEGVNLNDENLSSLHTSPNCMMTTSRAMSGAVGSTNCDVHQNQNQGCGVQFRNPLSYGSLFNRYGGGWYVMARSPSEGIRIWFWNRWDPTVPSEVRRPPILDDFGNAGLSSSALWGDPAARFDFGPSCSYADNFDPHVLIFDLTFCGDWAGSAYPSAGCPGSNCADYVDNHPEAFKNAYWEVNSLHVYTPRP